MKYKVVVMSNHFPTFREVPGITDQEFTDLLSARKAVKSRFRGRWRAPRGVAATVCDATGQVATMTLADGTVAIHAVNPKEETR